MSHELFREGGPHRIRRTGVDRYEMSVSLPKDRDGRTARECPDQNCSPGFFKVRPGTGLTHQKEAFCPYCRKAAAPSDFTTKAQIEYAKKVLSAEAHDGIQRALKDALGLDHHGRRQLVGGLINVSMELKASPKPHVWPPWAAVLKRDVVCPKCQLDQSVYGLAVWCADCGEDIFTTHILGELNVIRAMLTDVDRRKQILGERVAAKDVENSLEDLVSIFEAVLKIDIQRFLRHQGVTEAEIENRMRRIGSRLQSIANAETIVAEQCNNTPLHTAGDVLRKLDAVFQKRHPITHNLGVVDRKYLERVQSGELEGREVRVEVSDVETAATLVFGLLEDLHIRLFPSATKALLEEPPPASANPE